MLIDYNKPLDIIKISKFKINYIEFKKMEFNFSILFLLFHNKCVAMSFGGALRCFAGYCDAGGYAFAIIGIIFTLFCLAMYAA